MSERQPTVLVTGASSGIGLASALALARGGYRVLAGVRSDLGRAAVAACGLSNLSAVELDVTCPEQVAALVPEIRRLSPQGLYALVNNAGIGPPQVVELTDLDEFRRILEVNTIAPLRMIQACLPLLREGRGRIVNISSMNGAIALPMVGAYSASKFALEALSDALRIELRPWKIPVSLIRPGQVGTPIFDKARQALEERAATIPAELQSGYAKLFERSIKFNERGAHSASAPEAVAKVVLKAVRARRPRVHYIVGADARWLELARAGLPSRWLDSLIGAISGASGGKK